MTRNVEWEVSRQTVAGGRVEMQAPVKNLHRMMR